MLITLCDKKFDSGCEIDYHNFETVRKTTRTIIASVNFMSVIFNPPNMTKPYAYDIDGSFINLNMN